MVLAYTAIWLCPAVLTVLLPALTSDWAKVSLSETDIEYLHSPQDRNTLWLLLKWLSEGHHSSFTLKEMMLAEMAHRKETFWISFRVCPVIYILILLLVFRFSCSSKFVGVTGGIGGNLIIVAFLSSSFFFF